MYKDITGIPPMSFNQKPLLAMTPRIKVLLIILLCILAYVGYTLISTGFFRTVENQFSGQVVKKVDLPGAEDMTVHTEDGFAIISSTKREKYPPTKEEIGGLYFMDLKGDDFKTTHLTASFHMPFAPHGISLLKVDSTFSVAAINHTLQEHSIEIFTLKDEHLVHKKTMKDPTMISPNDIVLIDENRFYFTNDHGYTEGIGKFLEEYGGLSVSNVIYYDGETYKEVADGIAYANGINYDSKRNLIFVCSPRGFLVKVYSRNDDGSLEFIENIPCGTGVDNIEIDPEGNLWIGAHPNLIRFSSYAKGKKDISPSEIIKINYRAKNDYTIEKVYTEDGSTMSASTVAAPYKDLILTGNVMDEEFLILKKGN